MLAVSLDNQFLVNSGTDGFVKHFQNAIPFILRMIHFLRNHTNIHNSGRSGPI